MDYITFDDELTTLDCRRRKATYHDTSIMTTICTKAALLLLLLNVIMLNAH